LFLKSCCWARFTGIIF